MDKVMIHENKPSLEVNPSPIPPQSKIFDNSRILLISIVLSVAAVTALWKYFNFFSQRQPDLSSNKKLSNVTPSIVKTQSSNSSKAAQTSVKPPVNYGFSKSTDLKDVGVKVLLPQDAKVSLLWEKFYEVKSNSDPDDLITFTLKQFDGGGRRAWFQKEYIYYMDYEFFPFTGKNHNGYLVYSTNPSNKNYGSIYYISALNSSQMLVVNTSNNINGKGVFFGGDVDKFTSLVSTIELTGVADVQLESFDITNVFRTSDKSKTVWEDSSLGIRIISPEWTESRYNGERDSEGKYTYSDWNRTIPQAQISEGNGNKYVSITGGYLSGNTLTILPSKYQGKTFNDVVTDMLFPAGFCSSEWKESKSDCTSTYYCYTKDEVLQNLLLVKEFKIGQLEVQERGINQSFSETNDCRGTQQLLIKAINNFFVTSNIYPDGKYFRIEGM